MDDLKVAIVLPVFNVSDYLRECLNSILAQEYRNFILIAVNDGSTDDSLDILESYAEKDKRIIILNQNNLGISSARNRALELIETRSDIDCISFVDSDDRLDRRFLSCHVSGIVREGADVSVCGYISNSVKDKGKEKIFYSQKIFDQKEFIKLIYRVSGWERVHGGGGMVWKQVYKASIIKGLRFIVDRNFVEDEIFNIQVAKIAKKYIYIPENLYFYRCVSSSLTHHEQFQIRLMQGRKRCYELGLTLPSELKLLILAGFIEIAISLVKEGQDINDISEYKEESRRANKLGILKDRTYKRYWFYCHFPRLTLLVFKLRKVFKKAKA